MTTPGERRLIELDILRQPDDAACGPTCLHAVYRRWGDPVSLADVVAAVRARDGAGPARGTLAVCLGVDALARGYRARLSTFNLQMFDPTWFGDRAAGDPARLADKLAAQAEAKGPAEPRLRDATAAYLDFLRLGGEIRFEDLTGRLIASHIRAGRPVLTGLSATYLYRAPREFGPEDDEDDVRGLPVGHFVVIHGYDPARRLADIADPLEDNPAFATRKYQTPMSRLVPAIMLGVLTYDANLLVIEPPSRIRENGAAR